MAHIDVGALRLLLPQPSKEPEGQGPNGAREGHHEEVPQAVGEGQTAAEQLKGRAETFLDGKEGNEAEDQLQNLRPPDGLGLKANEAEVDLVSQEKSENATEDLVGVFHTVGVILGIDIGREREEMDKQQEGYPQRRHGTEEDPHALGAVHGLVDQRIKAKDQNQGHQRTDAHVKGRMHAEIHSGQRHQHTDHDADDPRGKAFGKAGDSAEDANRRLGMAAGEGIACGLGAGAFHNGKALVLHPRTGDTEQELHELIQHRSRKAHRQDIISLMLVDAPEEDQSRQDKEGLLAQVRDCREEGVQHGIADAFQEL